MVVNDCLNQQHGDKSMHRVIFSHGFHHYYHCYLSLKKATTPSNYPSAEICRFFNANERQVYISVSSTISNDNFWQQSLLAQLHQRPGLQWVGLQMCQRQFTTVVQNYTLFTLHACSCTVVLSLGWNDLFLMRAGKLVIGKKHMGHLNSWKWRVRCNTVGSCEVFLDAGMEWLQEES